MNQGWLTVYSKYLRPRGFMQIKGNVAKATKALKKEGWKIINLWECTLKPVKVKRTLTGLLKNIN
jgi:G:T-mismatch repair DNA endonuclease (very short patch repair protein)